MAQWLTAPNNTNLVGSALPGLWGVEANPKVPCGVVAREQLRTVVAQDEAGIDLSGPESGKRDSVVVGMVFDSKAQWFLFSFGFAAATPTHPRVLTYFC